MCCNFLNKILQVVFTIWIGTYPLVIILNASSWNLNWRRCMILLFPFRRKCFISVKGKKTYWISFTVHEKWDIHLFLTNAVYDLYFREEEMQVLNKTTNNRMAWLSFLSLIVCLSVAGLQVWHLKTFFEKKKLI